MFARALIVALAIAYLPTPAAADDGLGRATLIQGAMRACGGDAARLCADVVPGDGRIAQCLLDQEDQLSPECHTFVTRTRAMNGTVLACAADTQRYCSDVPLGGGRVVRCLESKRNLISLECSDALDEASAALVR